jgi:hypothetical protein
MVRLDAVRASLAVLVLAAAQPATAVVAGQVDDFQDGTTQNWFVGATGPFDPANVPDGGPAGLGDAFLELTAIGGGGAGSRLTVINATQWTGDYTSAGVTEISMEVNNLGTTDLALRLFFADLADNPGGAPNSAVSTLPVSVPAGSGWTSVSFPISAGDLTAFHGDPATALAAVAEVRIFHNPSATYPGPPIQAVLGVDDIQAVPEPAAALLSAAALAGLAGLRWHARARG